MSLTLPTLVHQRLSKPSVKGAFGWIKTQLKKKPHNSGLLDALYKRQKDEQDRGWVQSGRNSKKKTAKLDKKNEQEKNTKKGGDTMRNIRSGEFYCSVLWGVWFAFHAPSSDWSQKRSLFNYNHSLLPPFSSHEVGRPNFDELIIELRGSNHARNKKTSITNTPFQSSALTLICVFVSFAVSWVLPLFFFQLDFDTLFVFFYCDVSGSIFFSIFLMLLAAFLFHLFGIFPWYEKKKKRNDKNRKKKLAAFLNLRAISPFFERGITTPSFGTRLSPSILFLNGFLLSSLFVLVLTLAFHSSLNKLALFVLTGKTLSILSHFIRHTSSTTRALIRFQLGNV